MVAYYSNDEFETDGVCNQCYGGGFRVQCPHTDRPRFKVKERQVWVSVRHTFLFMVVWIVRSVLVNIVLFVMNATDSLGQQGKEGGE